MLRSSFAAFLIILITNVFVASQTAPQKPDVPQLGKATVRQVISAMTVEEKAKLLVGMGMDLTIPGFPGIDPEDKNTPEKVPGAAGRSGR